ncbi:S-LOCUS LECTIN KINASE FAMILY PROTEIN [Salix purpurea]|uniref:S-LOCUS LECTIN KINASE FAMILY PROTEIN n=1 Tax=Salix purpurea TaxID=77065 RepID=A0A9Q0WPK4_SALPP|nr:S-LOCUS LECTIN KINASE FAMILY PROTEIN [Salix purpurea]
MLWIKGTPSELIDECLAESSNSSDIIRCIHVALLCVQQRPEDRPNMSAVVLILGSDMPLPQPKQPGFFMGENPHEQRTSSNKHVTYSGAEKFIWLHLFLMSTHFTIAVEGAKANHLEDLVTSILDVYPFQSAKNNI